jgi:hypothetical protein
MTSCKIKFGVSFHANMSLEDIVTIWCKNVTPEIKARFPQLDQLMTIAKQTLDTIKLIRDIYKTVLLVFDTVKLAVELSAAITAQQGSTYVASSAGVEAQKLGFQLLQEAFAQVSVQITASFICSSDDIPLPSPNSPWLSELDKLILAADAALSIDFCN